MGDIISKYWRRGVREAKVAWNETISAHDQTIESTKKQDGTKERNIVCDVPEEIKPGKQWRNVSR
jgi:hypothetical protein